jgi:preprotein translocase subunit SecE
MTDKNEKAQAKATRSLKATSQKPAKKGSSSPLLNAPAVRFMRDAYYELRYKVTWPTFPEARNMTFAVIALSVALAIVLGGVDLGLTKLMQLIVLK